ncbi:hypothetical protein GGR25_001074 [Kaistia hirudinis]|uniref:General secretion pathway protein GspJ n=1 Tax=Kaistia hirudinis TaxID=1293440 RepID=A0A840AND3_9HYPH|nr:hypothetical protein [Kaistia hirudinis]MBB3930035.1 hypothetical protein [Kaistia hirudinis]
MIVTITVAALIATAGSGLMGFWSRLQARAAEVESRSNELLSATAIFRNLVSGAIPAPLQRMMTPRLDPESDLRSVHLTSIGPASLRLDRPTNFALSIRPTETGQDLMLDWTDPNSGEAHRETILRGFKDIGFRFLLRTPERTLEWSANWNAPSELPAAISLTAEDAVLGPPMEIIARTHGRMPASCVLLPADPSCREGGR